MKKLVLSCSKNLFTGTALVFGLMGNSAWAACTAGSSGTMYNALPVCVDTVNNTEAGLATTNTNLATTNSNLATTNTNLATIDVNLATTNTNLAATNANLTAGDAATLAS